MTKQDISHDSVSLHIAAPAEQLYEMVADVTRTPEFSPEILECHWVDGADSPAVGARFRARNKVPNRPSWTNKPVVTGMEPGRSFTFARTEKFAGTVEWSYRFEPDAAGTGTTVTEPLTAVGWFVIGTLFGRKDRHTDMRAGMEQTLERMRALAERDHERA